MNIGEFLDKLNNNKIDRKEENVPLFLGVIEMLSPISKITMLNHQEKWLGEKCDFEEFIIKQNEELKKCIEIELSDFGNMVRFQFELEPLLKETEIVEMDKDKIRHGLWD